MNEQVVRSIKITNEMGLHARPAAMLVQAIENLDCDVQIEKDGQQVNGKSIMGVMMLAAECGSELIVSADGPDADKAVEEIDRIVSAKFGEE